MDESRIREAIKTVSIPLHEGVKYATNTNTSYTIAGLGVNFSLLPYRLSETRVMYSAYATIIQKHLRTTPGLIASGNFLKEVL